MCGIAGMFLKEPGNELFFRQATDLLTHRGPDAGGYYSSSDGRVFLGHRRLSIIDVSQGANQPMHSADGRFVITYNGEVYNFKELKKKLPDFAWKTTGDTEVILELFSKYGAASFAWLNGIFAFAIYDSKERKIWLCRDQLGVKPLFIQRDKGKLVFASELKAICAMDKNKGDSAFIVSRKAVAHFLHLGYIPEPMTIYRGIKKFPAGNYACFDIASGEWNRTRYWNAADHYLHNPQDEENVVLEQYREKLFASVERQMISDVPLGTFLSGGIDSSLVSAVASKVSSKKINTYSIGFEDAAFDESVYAAQVAAHLGTQHHTFKVSADDILALVPEFLEVYDEPFADSSAFPTMLVSKLARQHVTVTLSGDGGDEFFQGYGMYQWAERLSQAKMQLLRKPFFLASKLMNERYRRAGLVFNFPSAKRMASHIFSQEQYLFSEQELRKLMMKKDFDFNELNQLPERGSSRERQAFWDVEHYLKDDLLVKVDRASMHYGLETRVPLLDRELVEFSLNVPLSLKINDAYGAKYLMKKVLYDMVPRELFERPKKGFSIPLNKWLAHELKPLVNQYLSKQKIEYAGMVDAGMVNSIVKQYMGGKTYLYNRVWALLVLHWWYFNQSKKQKASTT
ncbi:MAG: asparagine synthase (glutamine-hydrolyzing) [Chitinophagaceae bacterium]|nr:asparagine synthase (glutamine-hydrolyzing) [Chitinophagaceae bacterium]